MPDGLSITKSGQHLIFGLIGCKWNTKKYAMSDISIRLIPINVFEQEIASKGKDTPCGQLAAEGNLNR
jgi:hypothetical protein